jgi:hypothetical protein
MSRIRHRELEEDEYMAVASDVKITIDNAYDFLNHALDPSTSLARGYSVRFTGTYKAELRSAGTSEANDMLKSLESSFYRRKVALKKLRKRLRNIILEEIAEEMRSLLKGGKKAATSGPIATKGGALKSDRKEAKDIQEDLE